MERSICTSEKNLIFTVDHSRHLVKGFRKKPLGCLQDEQIALWVTLSLGKRNQVNYSGTVKLSDLRGQWHQRDSSLNPAFALYDFWHFRQGSLLP